MFKANEKSKNVTIFRFKREKKAETKLWTHLIG